MIAAAVGLLLSVLWLGASYAFADRLTRRLRPREAEALPEVAWAKILPGSLVASDGEQLGAWLIEGRPEQPIVILLHGNGGSRKDNLGIAEFLATEGMTVMMPTLRCHGDSTGERNDFGFSARLDVIAAVDLLEKRYGKTRPVYVLGRSLGAAAAAFAAPKLGHRVKGYILDSLYKDLKSAAWSRVNNAFPPVLDAVAYCGLWVVAPLVLKDGFGAIAPIEALEAVPTEIPILLLSGTEDRLARPEEAAAIFEKVAAHAAHVIFVGAGHGTFESAAPGAYRRAVLDFLIPPPPAVR